MRRLATRRFDFAASRAARRFVLASHAATLVLVAALPVGPLLAASLGLLVVASGLRAWRTLDAGLAGLVVRSDASVTALRGDGRAVEGTLAPGSVVRASYVAVRWRANGERGARVESVPWDRTSAGAHRELRAMLRYAISGEVAGRPASQARASIRAALSAFDWPARRWR
jgi:hypothetical protein